MITRLFFITFFSVVMGLSYGYASAAERVKNVEDFGAIANDGLDDTPAFYAAIKTGGDVYVPSGMWNIQTLNIKRQVHIYGPAAQGASVVYPAELLVANGGVGLFVHRIDTNADSSGIPYIEAPTTGADGTVIENLYIHPATKISKDPANLDDHGIWLKARASLRNLRVEGFAGNGIHIVASGQATEPAVRGNANSVNIENIQVRFNWGHGLFLDGADANAGYFKQVCAYQNNKWGMWDSSFLGNTYVASNIGLNKEGAYGGDNLNAKSVYLGTYVEGDGEVRLAGRSLVLGGFFGRIESGPAALYADKSGVVATAPVTAKNSQYSATVGGDPEIGEQLAFEKAGELPWRVQYNAPDNTDLVFRYGNYGPATPITITGANTSRKFGNKTPIPYQLVVPAIALGGGDKYTRRITYANAPVAGAEYARGDRLYYVNPLPGGKEGLVCVSGGIAGDAAVFKEFGSIEN